MGAEAIDSETNLRRIFENIFHLQNGREADVRMTSAAHWMNMKSKVGNKFSVCCVIMLIDGLVTLLTPSAICYEYLMHF